VGRAIPIATLGLTGAQAPALEGLCDVVIHAPAKGTQAVQELHRPIYHALCLALEAEFFANS
jgi:D-sedoheptulose 7-phosphate isomerase